MIEEPPQIRPLRTDELDAALALDIAAFAYDPQPGWPDLLRPTLEVERFIGAFDPAADDEMIGTAGIFTKEMTFPGHRVAPVAGVTWVSVRPGQQRRGVLRELMRTQLTELYDDEREPVAILTASESGIYGRFGYGSAARRMRVEIPQGSPFRPGTAHDRIREVPREQAFPAMAALYAEVAAGTTGYLTRSPAVWQSVYSDHPMDKDGATDLRFALHPDGYASYRLTSGWNDRGPAGSLLVHEVCARTPRARASLWRHLLDYSLVREVLHRRSWPDEPLIDLLASPRSARCALSDHIWLRIVDLKRAVPLRRYGVEAEVRIDLSDPFCPWNEGQWDLHLDTETGVAERVGATSSGVTGAAAPPTVALSAADLGAVFLGGTPVRRLAAAGLITGNERGIDLLHDAMAGRALPHTPEGF